MQCERVKEVAQSKGKKRGGKYVVLQGLGRQEPGETKGNQFVNEQLSFGREELSRSTAARRGGLFDFLVCDLRRIGTNEKKEKTRTKTVMPHHLSSHSRTR